MTKTIPTAAAFLLLSALPALAQTKPLTPPEVLGAAKTIQFTATLYRIGDPAGFYMVGSDRTPIRAFSVTLAQPNRACIVDTDARTKVVEFLYASDGKILTEYFAPRKHSVQLEAPTGLDDVNFRTLGLVTFADCFIPGRFAKFKDIGAVGVKENLLDHCYLLMLGIVNDTQTYEAIVVDHKTGLPMYASSSVDAKERNDWGPGTHDGSREVERIVFTNWKLNVPVDDSKFVYTPPAGGIRN